MRKKFAVKMPSVEWYLEGEKQAKALGKELVEILEKLSYDTELAVNFEIPHGERADSILDRQVNIYIYSTPFEDMALAELASVKIGSDVFTLPEGQSDSFDLEKHTKGLTNAYLKPIMDGNKKTIALVDNNNIYISFDLFHKINTNTDRAKQSLRVFQYVIDEARKHLLTDKKKIEQRILEMPILGYVRGVIENSGKMYEKKQKERDSVQKSLDSIHRNLVVELRRSEEINSFLQCGLYQHDEKKLMDKYTKPLLGLLKHGYTSLNWTGSTLKAKTDPIAIEFKGKKFMLGGYDITITTDNQITIKNMKNPQSSYDHPHVSNGRPCWGNIGTSASKLVAQFEFVPLLDIILTYLSAYNPGDAYHKLGNWSTGERCDGCGEDKECCICK